MGQNAEVMPRPLNLFFGGSYNFLSFFVLKKHMLCVSNCAPLVADLFLFCYGRDFITSLYDVKQAEIIEAFKSTSRYLDDLLNIDNPYFESMVNRIYPPELQLNKADTYDTEAPYFGFAFIYFKRICFI